MQQYIDISCIVLFKSVSMYQYKVKPCQYIMYRVVLMKLLYIVANLNGA